MSFDSLTEQFEKEDATAHQADLGRSALIVHNVNPDQHAANRKQAVDAGIHPAFATPAVEKPNAQKLHSLIDQFHELTRTAPKTASFMAEPDNAKLAHDDHPVLSTLEKMWETIKTGDILQTVSSAAVSPIRQVVEGYKGIASLATGHSLDEAAATMQKHEEETAYKPKTEAGKRMEGLISAPFKLWSAWGEKMVPDKGHPVTEALQRTAWELGPYLIGGGAVKHPEIAKTAQNAAHIEGALNVAKESKLLKRDPETFKLFSREASKSAPPVKMHVDKFDAMLAEKGLKPEDVLDDPTHYYEAKFMGEKVSIPASDLAAMAEHVTPEHVKDMSIGEAKTVNEVEAKVEQEKASDSKQGETPEEAEVTADKEPAIVDMHMGIPLHKGVKAAMDIAGDIRGSKAGKAVEKLMTPGLEAAHGIVQGVKSLVLPSAKSAEHLTAAEVLGAKLGKMHRNQEMAADQLRAQERVFDKMGVFNDKIPLTENAGIKFMSDMSQGRQMKPKLQAIADSVNKMFSDRLEQLEAADVPLESVRENYFPGMWTNESRKAFNQAMGGAVEMGIGGGKDINLWTAKEKAIVRDRVTELMKDNKGTDKSALSYLTKKPFKGKESFRKEKVFDDIMTGAEFGLEPVSPNPIEAVKLKLAEMDRNIMAQTALNEWRKTGDEKFLRVGEKMPEGWKNVDDKYGTVYGPRDMAGEGIYVGRPLLGHRIVKEPVADILNNYLSSSLYNNRYFGKAYKAYMWIANLLNQCQLGIGSAFHVGFTESEVVISGGANLIKDIYGVSNGSRTIKQLANTATEVPKAFLKTPKEGDAVLKEWRNPGSSMNPRVQRVAKAAELAGAGFKLESGLRTDQTSKMIQDWYGEKKVKAALRSPVSAIELMAKPIMDYLVPRQKAGVFGHLVDRIIEQNPGKTLEQLTPQFRQAWNRVDERLGQVRYDRLYMNNAAKNAVQGAIRAPGWSGGTIAELGGGFKDAGGMLKEWADTGELPKELPDRVAYTISLLAMTTAVNGLLTYAFTGEKPNGTDFWAFRTGGTDEFGRPERFVLPTYAKDLYAYYEDAPKTLMAKTHPIISIMGDLIKNKDYYGVTIANEDDAFILRQIERGEYVLKAFEPFWIRGAKKEAERGGGLWETMQTQPQKLFAPQVGIMPATSAYTLSPAEKMMNKFIGEQIPQGGRTQEAADTSKARREIVRAIRNGATIDTLPEKLQEKADKLTDRQTKNIKKDAELTPLQLTFKHMQDPDMGKTLKVWAKANDQEREELRDLFDTRIDEYKLTHDLSDDEIEQLNQRIEKAEARQ